MCLSSESIFQRGEIWFVRWNFIVFFFQFAFTAMRQIEPQPEERLAEERYYVRSEKCPVDLSSQGLPITFFLHTFEYKCVTQGLLLLLFSMIGQIGPLLSGHFAGERC